jgi:hypothetical protein
MIELGFRRRANGYAGTPCVLCKSKKGQNGETAPFARICGKKPYGVDGGFCQTCSSRLNSRLKVGTLKREDIAGMVRKRDPLLQSQICKRGAPILPCVRCKTPGGGRRVVDGVVYVERTRGDRYGLVGKLCKECSRQCREEFARTGKVSAYVARIAKSVETAVPTVADDDDQVKAPMLIGGITIEQRIAIIRARGKMPEELAAPTKKKKHVEGDNLLQPRQVYTKKQNQEYQPKRGRLR